MRLTPLPTVFLEPDTIPSPDHPDFLYSPFLLVGETQRILRDWKKRPSLGMEKILSEAPSFQKTLEEIRLRSFDAVIPIPQATQRAFQLRGGPANRIAEILARELQIPKISGLATEVLNESPQGQKMGVSRYSNTRAYRWDRIEKIPGKLLLVDDFWTSGQTIRAAARALRRDGCSLVGAFVLGFRPFLNQTGRKNLVLEFNAELNAD